MKQKSGVLTLIPTPIGEDNPLDSKAYEVLKSSTLRSPDEVIWVHEELKVGIRKWCRWGFPRECIKDFVLLNEHNFKQVSHELSVSLKRGIDVFLMCDCGLPAFCDPGQFLIDICHDEGIKVTSTPFPNAPILALVLSGFPCKKFVFQGFMPIKDKKERIREISTLLKDPKVSIVMDTPYRLVRLLEEISQIMLKERINRDIFLALDLSSSKETLLRGNVNKIEKHIKRSAIKKREFVMIIK